MSIPRYFSSFPRSYLKFPDISRFFKKWPPLLQISRPVLYSVELEIFHHRVGKNEMDTTLTRHESKFIISEVVKTNSRKILRSKIINASSQPKRILAPCVNLHTDATYIFKIISITYIFLPLLRVSNTNTRTKSEGNGEGR